MKILPTKLKKEPLIDAVFEVRFSARISASSVLPGILFRELDGEKNIESLPIAQVPEQIRENDLNLRYAPVKKLAWDNIFIQIGDRSLSVLCRLPYPGWDSFKAKILKIISEISRSGIIQMIERFSLKYIDIISLHGDCQPASLLNLSLMLGNHTLDRETFFLRIEIQKNELIHAISVASHAKAKLQDGSTREGLILDIDSIYNTNNLDFSEWFGDLEQKLDYVHHENKEVFFDCLRDETVQMLEPDYD
jgi:uncharacterized protein (TIGR04255 family)